MTIFFLSFNRMLAKQTMQTLFVHISVNVDQLSL